MRTKSPGATLAEQAVLLQLLRLLLWAALRSCAARWTQTVGWLLMRAVQRRVRELGQQAA